MNVFLFPVLASVLDLVSCQNIMITTSFEGNYVCPNDEIVFTCTTNGLALAWTNDEYIGQGNDGHQLEFGSEDPVGYVMRSTENDKTFAELTAKGDGVMESQLHITVSEKISTANVTCSDSTRGSSFSVQFELASLPNVPRNVTAFEITPPPGDNCIILVNWIPPSNTNSSLVKRYNLESPAGNFTTKTTRTKIAVALLAHHCKNGSNAHISIHAIDSCGRNGASSNDSIVIVTELLNSSSSVTTVTQHSNSIGGLDDQRYPPEQEYRCPVAIVGGILGGIIVVLLIALGIALCWVAHIRMHETNTKGATSDDRLEARIDNPIYLQEEICQETGAESCGASDVHVDKPDTKLRKSIHADTENDMSSKSLLEHKEDDDDDDDNINEAHQDTIISENVRQEIDPESCGASDSSSKSKETGHKDKKPEEEMPKEHQETGSGTKSRVASDFPSKPEDPTRKDKSKKSEWRKSIHEKDEMSIKSLLAHADHDDDDDDNTIDTHQESTM